MNTQDTKPLPTDAEIAARIEAEPMPERLVAELGKPLTKTDQLRVLAGIYHENTQLADELVELAGDMDADADMMRQERDGLLLALDAIKSNHEYHAMLGLYIDGTVTGEQDFGDWAAGVADAAIRKATGAPHATP